MQFYSDRELADRYDRSRPYFHPVVMEHVSNKLGLTGRLSFALDAGCGTGASLRVLTGLADRIVGLDGAEGMLRTASKSFPGALVQGVAERLPYLAGSFDMITASRAFHWFDRSQFLPEVRRVLRPGGWLVAYGSSFFDVVLDDPELGDWYARFHERYQRDGTERDYTPMSAGDASRYGLSFLGREQFTYAWTCGRDNLVGYLSTLSSVSLAIDRGRETKEGAVAWLSETLDPIFNGADVTLRFNGNIEYLQKPA
jgi:ubiquinone/menaquinone biosynthesis C-methylase UbiE